MSGTQGAQAEATLNFTGSRLEGALARLAQAVGPAQAGALAPVHLWNPPFCGDLPLEIRADGSWHYMGTPIARPALVRLFSSVLKREGERYFLVTPHEKVGITVEDAPFLAIAVEAQGAGQDQNLLFATATGERILADGAHRLCVAPGKGADDVRPYLHVRGGLEALIARPVYYALAELAQAHEGRLGVWSGGVFFPLERV